MVYITRGLLEVLRQMASDAEPDSVSVALGVTSADELTGAEGISPRTPVFTYFYLPDAGRSITAVFGVDISTPPGRTRGRFISHPLGKLSVSRTDELHGVVFVAVPPWEEASVAAFDRAGRKLEIAVLDAVPPEESFDAHSR